MKPLRRIQPWSAFTSVLVSGLLLLNPALTNTYSHAPGDGRATVGDALGDDHDAVPVRTPVMAETDGAPQSIAQKVHYDRIVDDVARTYGLDSALLHAVISVESSYRSTAVSRKGAAGLMQLMPAIARHYGVADPLDPVQNLNAGAKHLRHLLKAYDNDVSLALAAYNAGETAVAKHGRQIPPSRETTSYVPRVLGFYRKYRAEAL